MNHGDPNLTTASTEFEDYRAPRGHLQFLAEPGIDRAAATMRESAERAHSIPGEILRLRTPAREQLVKDASRYTGAYRDVDLSGRGVESIVMAGHQPALFHPGVWFKNFALHRLAKTTGSIAVNLVVDSDVAPPSSIRVPSRSSSAASLQLTNVSYDRLGGGVPYEQSLVEDRARFDSFDRSVADAVTGLVDRPLVHGLWKYAREAIQRCGYAGCALAQARHRLEADLGIDTLEIPQSVVCRGDAFASFAVAILSDLPRFHRCYNEATEFYRNVHGIRSKSHPVPNLGRDGDWYEAPFWVYGNQSPQRRGVWVRLSSGGKVMEISDRHSRQRKIDLTHRPNAEEAFAALASPEFKLRSRALITTLFARLVLSDLFIHGIGGGKYDQLGDLICRDFWGTRPPNFMVMSATVLLPGHESHLPSPIDHQLRELKRSLRDLEFQPERFSDAANIPAELRTAKRQLLDDIPAVGHRSQWHQEISEVNRQMASSLGPLRDDFRSQRDRLLRRKRDATIWNGREHSFCIYPVDYLCEAYNQMLGNERG